MRRSLIWGGVLLALSELVEGRAFCRALPTVVEKWPRVVKKPVAKPFAEIIDKTQTGKCVLPKSKKLLARNRAIVAKASLKQICPRGQKWLRSFMIDRFSAHEKAYAEQKKRLEASGSKAAFPLIKLAQKIKDSPEILRPDWPKTAYSSRTVKPTSEGSGELEWNLASGDQVEPQPLSSYQSSLENPESSSPANPISGRINDAIIFQKTSSIFHCELSDEEIEILSGGQKLPFKFTERPSRSLIVLGNTVLEGLADELCSKMREIISAKKIFKEVDLVYFRTGGILIGLEYQISGLWEFDNLLKSTFMTFMNYKIALLRPTISAQNRLTTDFLKSVTDSAEHEGEREGKAPAEGGAGGGGASKTLDRPPDDWCLLYQDDWLQEGLRLKSIPAQSIREALRYWNTAASRKATQKSSSATKVDDGVFENGCELTDLAEKISKAQKARGVDSATKIDWCVSSGAADKERPPLVVTALEWTGLFSESEVILVRIKKRRSVRISSWECTRRNDWKESKNLPEEAWAACVLERARWTPSTEDGHLLDLRLAPQGEEDLQNIVQSLLKERKERG